MKNASNVVSLNVLLGKPPKLKCNGIGRDVEHDKSAVVFFNRPLTDAELRFFHDVCKRTAPLMDGVTDA